jgi:hypothetical protein
VCVNGKIVAETFATIMPFERVTEECDGSGGNSNILSAEQRKFRNHCVLHKDKLAQGQLTPLDIFEHEPTYSVKNVLSRNAAVSCAWELTCTLPFPNVD